MKLKYLFAAFAMAALMPAICSAQGPVVQYQTFIYTNQTLSQEIQKVNDMQDSDATRRFGTDLLDATLNAGKGLASGYVTSFIDMGVNAIASLVTRNARLKEEWLKSVEAENSWSTSINTIEEVKDFYERPSRSGALDPKGMVFDGIGCLRTDGNDTLFFISCHVDRSKLYRIVNHSKFELVLDTLIINPTESNLPNTALPLEFSFDERKDFNLSVNIRLTSSWFTDAIELHTDELLGEFTINIPVEREDLDENGRLHYIRRSGEVPEYEVVGESFIVPRSYMGFRDENDNYDNIWGTGQYNLAIELKESCGITDSYRENWKKDRRYRKSITPHDGLMANVWERISTQKWDEITKSWIITTLSAPAGVISNKLIEEMKLAVPQPQTPAAAGGAKAAAPKK